MEKKVKFCMVVGKRRLMTSLSRSKRISKLGKKQIKIWVKLARDLVKAHARKEQQDWCNSC